LKVNVTAGKPERFEATGNVVFVSASGTATGDNGIYRSWARTVTMTGHVVLTKNKDVMHGTMLVVTWLPGEAHLSAHGAPGKPRAGSLHSSSAVLHSQAPSRIPARSNRFMLP